MARKQYIVAETLTGDRVLTAQEFYDWGTWDVTPGAARNVDLPAGSAALAGQQLIIRNAAQAAHTITVRLTSGGETIATATQGQTAIVYCHGTVLPTFTAVVLKVGAT